MANDVEHVYIWLFAVCLLLWSVSSYLLLVFSLCHLFCGVLSILYILDTEYMYFGSDMCFTTFYSKSVAYLFILLKVSITEQFLNFNDPAYHFLFLSWIDFFLMLYLKTHHQTQGHLDFFPCYILEVLWFYILHLGLWSIWVTFCKRCKVSV